MTRRGFTLVELLIVIAIIGVLFAILLPAVQAAREAARRTECMNHLKQLSLAFLNHEQAQRAFPSGGWSHTWIGEPERGIGRGQPGGWPYQVLPFLEEQALFDLGLGLKGDARRDAFVQRLSTPLPIHHCPTRRSPGLFPNTTGQAVRNDTGGSFTLLPNRVAKNDYAASIGDADNTCCPISPRTVEDWDRGYFQPPDTSDHSGVSYAYSWVRQSQVTDGSSQTYMLGEKHLNPEDYETGRNGGDGDSLYHGHNSDLERSTRIDYGPPRHDQMRLTMKQVFGSAHSAGCNFAMCDGSVRTISYDIDPETHRRLGNRHDGLIADGD